MVCRQVSKRTIQKPSSRCIEATSRKKRWSGSFVDWDGRDGQSISSSAMCGSWDSDTTWRHGENVSC